MSLSIMAWVLIPCILFGVARGFRIWLYCKSKELVAGQIEITEKQFGVSVYYWFIISFFAVIGFISAFNGRTNDGHILWDVVFITLLVVGVILIPAIILGLKGKVQYQDGKFLYDSGFRRHQFSAESILKCEIDGLGLIKITYTDKSKSPIILPPIFQEIPLLLALLQFHDSVDDSSNSR